MTRADVECVHEHLHDPEYSSLRYAERVYEVPPMAMGDGHALFVERASAVRPGFQPDEHVHAAERRWERHSGHIDEDGHATRAGAGLGSRP